MPITQSIQNNFIAGLKTEATGLNFPENAWTDGDNIVPSLIGDVFRREGIDYEANFQKEFIEVDLAKNSYRWRNVGGDGTTEIIVVQRGVTLYFYVSSASTITSPLSAQLIASTVNITSFQAVGNVNDVSLTECQFADGNGFLIVYHKDCDTFSCTFNANTLSVTATAISFQIRDFVGIPEPNVPDNFRPTSLSPEHQYNLTNQGWTFGSNWSGQGTNNSLPLNFFTNSGNTWVFPTVGQTWTINLSSQTNTTSLTNGSTVQVVGQGGLADGSGRNINSTVTVTGSVIAYSTPFSTVQISVTSVTPSSYAAFVWAGGNGFSTATQTLSLSQLNVGFITTWQSQIGNYPSNSDVWWLYKNTSDQFSPGTMFANVQQNVGPAPKGSYLLNPWRQQRTSVSAIAGLSDIITTARPTNGCWFQGRVFFTGLNASQQPIGDEPYTTWTENIYFSQIIDTPSQFGKTYQRNDPTTEDLFEILANDGGVITIQGCGAVFKLFPIENGLLVFAANGIWFITGSQGIGFSATDYVIRQISKVQCISTSNFVTVNGFPMFWNEEGIYYVTPAQQGAGLGINATSFDVQNIALGSILTYYQGIPKQSKIFARGDYNPVDFVVTWVFRSTPETGIADRYNNDKALCFNTVNKAFYTYSFPSTSVRVCDVKYVSYPGASGTNVPDPSTKYLVNDTAGNFTFAEERDLTYVDFFSQDGGTSFDSHFISGYNLAGKSLLKFQPVYVYFYLRNTVNNAYKIQGVWDYSISRTSSKWSNTQVVRDNTDVTKFNTIFRRHKIVGRGMSLSFKVTSLPGEPFDVIGWSVLDNLMQTV